MGIEAWGVNVRANTVNSTETNSNEINVEYLNATSMSGANISASSMSGANISGDLYRGVPFVGPQWFGENVTTTEQQLVFPSPSELVDNVLSSYAPGFSMSIMGGTVTTDDTPITTSVRVNMYTRNTTISAEVLSATGAFPASSFTGITGGGSLTARALFSPSGLVLAITDVITFKATTTDAGGELPEVAFIPFGKLYEF